MNEDEMPEVIEMEVDWEDGFAKWDIHSFPLVCLRAGGPVEIDGQLYVCAGFSYDDGVVKNSSYYQSMVRISNLKVTSKASGVVLVKVSQ